MYSYLVNVGMFVDGQDVGVTEQQVIDVLQLVGCDVGVHRALPANDRDEPTVVAQINRLDGLDRACDILNQQAIAVMTCDGCCKLYGRGAASWGAPDPERFRWFPRNNGDVRDTSAGGFYPVLLFVLGDGKYGVTVGEYTTVYADKAGAYQAAWSARAMIDLEAK